MKNFILLIILALLAFHATAQTKQTIGVDTLKIGDSASAHDTTLELSGTNVKIRANKTSGKAEFTNDGSIWKKLGSGTGGGAGAFSMLENGGFEDGVTSEWESTTSTVTAVTGASALLGETSASFDPSAQNDYLRTAYKTVPKGIRGAACEARFLYTGGDALNYSAKVETESGVVLGSFRNEAGNNVLPLHLIPGYESVFFKCPTESDIATLATNGNVRLVIYQGTATNAAAMVVEDAHSGGLIGLVETSLPDTFAAAVTSTGVVSTESADFINGNCSVSDTSLYTCSFNSGFTVAPVCTVSARDGGIIYVGAIQSIGATGVGVRITSNGGTKTAVDFQLQCAKVAADAKQSVQVYKSIPRVSQNENKFSAKVAATGALTSEDVDFVTNCVKNSAGNYTCNFVSGVFTVNPSCVAESVGGSFTEIVTISTSAITIQTRNSASTVTDSNFDFSCSKQGVDYKAGTVQPTILGQVTSSVSEGSALTNIRTETCKVANSGSASLDSSSGMCESWMQSVTRNGAGDVTGTIKAGIFSSVPVCDFTVHKLAGAASVRGHASSATSWTVDTFNTSFAQTDFHFTVSCTGKR